MKVGATAGFAILAAAALVIAFLIRSPEANHSPSQPPLVTSTPNTSFDTPRNLAPPSSSRQPDTISLEDLTRQTIESLSSADTKAREQGLSHWLPELAARDPMSAARVADLFVDSPLRPRILVVVAKAWADVSRLHALAWAQGLSDSEERQSVQLAILDRVSQSDPAGAVSLRQQLETNLPEDAELVNLAQRWAESDLSATLGWIDSLPPGSQRDQLTARAAFIQSRSNPGAAAQLVLDRIPDGEARTEALVSVVHQWALQDMDAAAAWVERIPERILRERARDELDAARRAGK